MKLRIDAICAGKPAPFRGHDTSAIAKSPITGNAYITYEGILGDEQADRVHHGGPEMAVHLYPRDHHDFWRAQIGPHPLLDAMGAFGSNLCVSGIAEEDVFIGDVFAIGGAIVEISQPRKPCWKIDHRFGHQGMAAAIVDSAKSGWYFRVLQEGEACAGDHLRRIESGRTKWNVAYIFKALLQSDFAITASELADMAECALLSPVWQGYALRKRNQEGRGA